MLKNREVILAKVETTYNTDSVPVAATDAALVKNPSWALEGLTMIDREVVKANLSKEQQIYGGTLRKISFETEVKGSGAAGTAPEIGVLMRGCAMSETVVASTSVTYEPTSSAHESLTIYYFMDGVRYILTGCRGNVVFTLTARGILMAAFEFTGHSDAATDVALPSPTYDTTVPTAIKGLSFTVGGYSAVINELTVDLGNAIAIPSSVSASDGYGEIRISDRDVQGSLDPEHTLIATNDFEADLRAGTLMALTTGVIGATAGNRVQVDLDQVYYTDISPADRDAVRTLSTPIRCKDTSGDDDATFIFT